MTTRCTCPPALVPRDLSELCPWCQRLRLGDTRIEAALANLGADHRPRAGWDANVLATKPTPDRYRRTALMVVVLVVAGLCAMSWWRLTHHEQPLKLELKIENGDPR